jgi:hypothetical protein
MLDHGPGERALGGVAQLVERLLCKQEVIGSIPFTSTSSCRMAGLLSEDGLVDGSAHGFQRLPLGGCCYDGYPSAV